MYESSTSSNIAKPFRSKFNPPCLYECTLFKYFLNSCTSDSPVKLRLSAFKKATYISGSSSQLALGPKLVKSNKPLYVDTTVIVDGIAQDTTLKGWDYDQLQDPVSVAAFGNRSALVGNEDEIIFVADRNTQSIKLFMLSVSEEDLPGE